MAEAGIRVLSYAVRGRVIFRYGGQLALILAVLLVAPLVVAVASGEQVAAWRYAMLIGLFLPAGGALARIRAPERIQANEALTITALAFALPPLLLAWPLMTAGIPFQDALFEAVSGITTTGLSTAGSVEQRPASFLFARAWLQWLGGLGIVVLSVALLIGHRAAARRLVDPAEHGEALIAAARTHARHSLYVYLVLTVAGLALVWAASGNGWSALLHVLAAVSTGGFSTFDASLAGLGSRTAAGAVIAVSFLGAVSLPLYWRVVHAGWRAGLRQLIGDVELRALIVASLLVSVLLAVFGQASGTAGWYDALITGISAQTTTGFASMPVADLDPTSKAVTILAMLTGGSVGSSAGGFKLLRLLILLRLLQLMVSRAGMPAHAVAYPHLAGHRLEADDLLRALQLVLLFAFLVVLSWVPFLLMGYDPLDALFEVVSAAATTGLSTGISRPELEPLLKGVLMFAMLAGRLEIMAMLVVLYPGNWFGRREDGP